MNDRRNAGFALVAWTGFTIALAGCSPPGGTPSKESTPPKEEPKTVAKESTPPAQPGSKDGKAPPPAGSPPAKTETPPASAPGQPHPGLMNPSLANEKAPDKYKVKFNTTKGDVVIEVTREWSPNGADRFYNLVKAGYFTDVAFFRAVENFMAQFGIHGDPKVNEKWQGANIQDDPVKQSNLRGFVTYAQTRAPNSRSTQYFINYKDNSFLDSQRFAPFGQVVQGMEVIDSLYKGYGESTTQLQGEIYAKGNEFLKARFPNLDYIKSAAIVP